MSDAADRARLSAWLAVRDPLERQLQGIGTAAIDAAGLRPGDRVLDIGCGIGGTIDHIADRVGPQGQVVGVDVLAAAIELRRRETAQRGTIVFLQGDAQTLALPPATFDAAVSRFGVMFFADPVAAFANIRAALRPGGRLAFACWRTLAENELDAFPLEAAAPCLPNDPVAAAARAEHFAFADPAFLDATLSAAGYRQVTGTPLDIAVTGGSLAGTVAVCTRFGSLGKILREHPQHRVEATALFKSALRRRGGDDPPLRAATWIVRAINPG